MHELAHAYFDGALNRQAPDLEAAYATAMQQGLYADVLRNSGRRQEADATRNVSEYFAELTEAYFGENDFQPFTRTELQDFDPMGYAGLCRA